MLSAFAVRVIGWASLVKLMGVHSCFLVCRLVNVLEWVWFFVYSQLQLKLLQLNSTSSLSNTEKQVLHNPLLQMFAVYWLWTAKRCAANELFALWTESEHKRAIEWQSQSHNMPLVRCAWTLTQLEGQGMCETPLCVSHRLYSVCGKASSVICTSSCEFFRELLLNVLLCTKKF